MVFDLSHYKADSLDSLDNSDIVASIYTDYFRYTLKNMKTEQNLMNTILNELGIGDGMNEE